MSSNNAMTALNYTPEKTVEKVEEKQQEDSGYKSGEEKHGDEFGECAICYTELTAKTTVATPCNHLFCSDCFFKWLHESKTCPMCRTNYVEYSKWDYERPFEDELTHEFKLFRDIISRSSDALTERYKKKKRLDDAINHNNIYIEQKRGSCSRMEKDLEYKRGYYAGAHFPITEMNLYNAVTEDEETKEWKTGFKNGIKAKYNAKLFEDYTNIVEPAVVNARKKLKMLALVEDKISSETYDRVKNDMHRMLKCLARNLEKEEFLDIFKHGIVVDKDGKEQQVGITYEQFMKDKDISLEETMYVDFMRDSDGKMYKMPYYINPDDNSMAYLSFEIELCSKENARKSSMQEIFDKNKQYKLKDSKTVRQLFTEAAGTDATGLEEGEIVEWVEEDLEWVAPFSSVEGDEQLW